MPVVIRSFNNHKLYLVKSISYVCSTLFLLTTIITVSCSSSKSMIELSPNQSMCMTGKGPGQDGAINPYYGELSFAIIKNKSDRPLGIRIQEGEKVILIKEIEQKSKAEIRLESNQQLYFDSQYGNKVSLSFKKG